MISKIYNSSKNVRFRSKTYKKPKTLHTNYSRQAEKKLCIMDDY